MMKDWTGNKKSVFATLGASNHSKQERETMDYYATEPKAIDLLASKFDIPHRVWECACGGGSLSQRLKERGHEVISTDIIDRGYEGFDGECDFLSRLFHPTIEGDYAIVTNPPYKFVTELANRLPPSRLSILRAVSRLPSLLRRFVLTALDVLPDGCYLCLFLKTTALESRGRWEKIYKTTPPDTSFSASTASSAPRMQRSRTRGRISAQGLRLTHGSCGRRATRAVRRSTGYESVLIREIRAKKFKSNIKFQNL